MEIMIVIGIIITIAGLVGINVSKALREQRFRSEVDLVIDELRLAQDLMLTFNGNVHVKIWPNESQTGFEYGLAFDHPMPFQWSRELQRTHPVLREIHYVDIYPKADYDEKSKGMDIKFLSGGAVMSTGVLRLSTSLTRNDPGALESYICLPGHPSPFVCIATYEEAVERLKSEEGFDDQLTTRTREEIRKTNEL